MVIMPTYKISGVEIPNEELHFAYITHKLRNQYGFIESSKKNIPVNDKGEVIDGDSNEILEINENWTFIRKLNSKNPNWTLLEISET